MVRGYVWRVCVKSAVQGVHAVVSGASSAKLLQLSGYAIPPTPNRGAPYLTASTARMIDEGGPPRFRRISTLAAPPGPGVGCNQFLSTVGCSGLDSQLLGTILKPFPTIFGFLGPGPLSEYLTHFEILEIQFFSNSPRDSAHWNRTAILDLGVPSV